MKKLLLILIVIACATQLKAQQSAVKPFDQSLFKAPKEWNLHQFKLGDSTLLKNFSTLPKDKLLAATTFKLPDYNMAIAGQLANIDHMPIAKMNGNIDHMPIAKMDGNIDKMPVAKITPLGLPKSITP